MHDNFFKRGQGRRIVLFLFLGIPFIVQGQIKTWTGEGGDGLWSNPLNWSGMILPVVSDDVLLDNGDLPGSYQVLFPDRALTIRTLTITPSSGNNIELILPASNKETDALTVSGPGYGIILNAGAVFRNSSGVASGESLHISDSIRINDGGKYIHNTRASHAAGIVQILSSAPGTEKGIFAFDVPRASYTISVSNRTYGSLDLSSAGYGSVVNYTCSGNNPLAIRGDLRIGTGVNLSVNLSGLNGNIQVSGDFIQEEGNLNLASGAGNRTMLRIGGNFNQSPGAIISATSTADPAIELNGGGLQLIAAGGAITNGVGFRVNNPAGSRLLFPLTLPHRLELIQGRIYSSPDNLLTLSDSCSIQADSTQANRAYVDGPLRKEGLNNESYFLFPVGKDGSLRWLEMKKATGNFTVEYMNENPASLGGNIGSGIDHISKMEYWVIKAEEASGTPQANVELSYTSPQSGGITDPAFLNVSGYSGNQWSDEGHADVTGSLSYGSVVSDPIHDFTGEAFTLASTVNLENPLPLTIIRFEGKEKNGFALLNWTIASPEDADHFEVLEAEKNEFHVIARIPAALNRIDYLWREGKALHEGLQFYKLNVVGRDGNIYPGKTVFIKYIENKNLLISCVPARLSGKNEIQLRALVPTLLEYRIISSTGQLVKRGSSFIPVGESDLMLPELESGIYQFWGMDSGGRTYGLRFLKN